MSNRELGGEFAVNVNDCELFYQKRATKHHNGRLTAQIQQKEIPFTNQGHVRC